MTEGGAYEETDTIVAVWLVFASQRDYFAQVWREQNGRIGFKYRFRYYADDSDPFLFKDEKQGMSGYARAGAALEDVVAHQDFTAYLTAMKWGSKVERIDINAGPEEYCRILSSHPCMHVKMSPKGEAS